MKSKSIRNRTTNVRFSQILLNIAQTPLPGMAEQHATEVKFAAYLALDTGLHFDDVIRLTWDDLSVEGHINTWDEDIGEVLVGITDLVSLQLNARLKTAAPSNRVFPALQPGDREHMLHLMESYQCIEKYLKKRFRLLRVDMGSPEAQLAIAFIERGIMEWRSNRR